VTLEPNRRADRGGDRPGSKGASSSELGWFPPFERWGNWTELDAKSWPRRVERHYRLLPTICFNCEAACGLLAYIDQDTSQVAKIEGNPLHPGSRGRNCAKGPATLSQIQDPERILFPLKRTGPRGKGQYQRVSWDEVLDDISGRIRRALDEKRGHEVMYHVGRPGHDGAMERILRAWGIDGHNSHTNVCSASARLGYSLWQGSDRPSPDYENARFMLLISAHLETGHYFNPHAQRIIDAKSAGARLSVIDARLSNTASMADDWIAPWPGTEAALLLAIAREILELGAENREFMRRWVDWRGYLENVRPTGPMVFEHFLKALREQYASYTPEFAEHETGVKASVVRELAGHIVRAGTAFSSHVWRSAASGNLGGWQVARCLFFLHVLTGSVGTKGGVAPNNWNKFVPQPFAQPPAQKTWNELLFPREYPLSHFEMSFLLPHLLRDQRKKLSVYFTRVYNPVWTNPDGASWMEMLLDESRVELHVALTPTWNETAYFADYVLPMGHATERHDLMSQETHAGRWIGFRQPVLRTYREEKGERFEHTYQANPGEVWEEDEFWNELSWRIDADGSRGIRKHFESPYRPGQKISVEEHYRWMFENSVPGLPQAAAAQGMQPLEYMKRVGAFAVPGETYSKHETPLNEKELAGSRTDESGRVLSAAGKVIGVEVDGRKVHGFDTESKRLEMYSKTLKDWGWPEYALPTYIQSHVHWSRIDSGKGEYLLLPTFRLPTLIHTRSGNSKWLYEISHSNPLWVHPIDARRIEIGTGGLVRVTTEIGYFVLRCWVTEGLRPGVVACSHHLGRWRLKDSPEGLRWAGSLVDLSRQDGTVRMRVVEGVRPFKSEDPDSERVFWSEGGVHQNLTFPVHPDPVSGMHCWHQKVTVKRAEPDDRFGDVFADLRKARAVYDEWLRMTHPAPGPGNLRRPLHMLRAFRPDDSAYYFGETRSSRPSGD